MNTNLHLALGSAGAASYRCLPCCSRRCWLARRPLTGESASQYAVGDRPAAPALGKGEFHPRSAGTTSSLPTGTPRASSPASSSTSSRDNDPRAAEGCSACASGTVRPWSSAWLVRVRIPGFVVPLETSGEKIRRVSPRPVFRCVHVRRRPPTSSSTSSPTSPCRAAGTCCRCGWTGHGGGRIDSDMGTAGLPVARGEGGDASRQGRSRRFGSACLGAPGSRLASLLPTGAFGSAGDVPWERRKSRPALRLAPPEHR